MKERIKAHINEMFRGAALTIANAELREEILNNTLDRYDDLLAEGENEEAAYQEAIGGIGDVSQLIEREEDIRQAQWEAQSRGSQQSRVPPAVQTHIYPDDEVEERQEADGSWSWEYQAGPTKKVANSLQGVVWMLGLALYFFISFRYDLWYISWVLFLILPAISCFLDAWALSRIKGVQASRGGVIGGLWMGILSLYFIVSFGTGAWHVTWILFLVATALTSVVNAIYDLERSKHHEP